MAATLKSNYTLQTIWRGRQVSTIIVHWLKVLNEEARKTILGLKDNSRLEYEPNVVTARVDGTCKKIQREYHTVLSEINMEHARPMER